MWYFRNNQWFYQDNADFNETHYLDPLIYDLAIYPWDDDPLGFGRRRKIEGLIHGMPNQHLGYEYHYSPVGGIQHSWFERKTDIGLNIRIVVVYRD